MERLPLLFGLFVIGLFSQSCQKEDVDIDIKSNDWQVIEVEWDDQSTSEGTDSLYIIQFQSDTTVLLMLDVNTCFGSYVIQRKGDIEFEQGGCTEICCDSEYAAALPLLLSKMKHYYEKGERLYFEGDGKMILKKY
jgi:hypothetical protein